MFHGCKRKCFFVYLCKFDGDEKGCWRWGCDELEFRQPQRNNRFSQPFLPFNVEEKM